jgi:hypothetical protein
MLADAKRLFTILLKYALLDDVNRRLLHNEEVDTRDDFFI